MSNDISKTEIEVIRLKCKDGLDNKEIAEVLHRSPDTIRSHFQHIHEKWEVHNTSELFKKALKTQIIKIEEL